MNDGHVDQVQVGVHLRTLRQTHGHTLAELSSATGLTTSTLSRLENGLRRPTLEQLVPLARFYRVPLDDLVGTHHNADPRIHLKPISKDGMVFVPLTRRAGGIQAFKVIYPPASRWGPPTPQSHDGYEWFYVMNGTVRFLLSDRVLTVGAGEAVEFDARRPHWIGSDTEQLAEVLVLIGPQGEKAHLTVADA